MSHLTMSVSMVRWYVYPFSWSVVLAVLGARPSIAQPPICPRPPLARLAQITGEWNVRWEYRESDTLRLAEHALAVIEPTAGNCGILQRLDGEFPNGRAVHVTMLFAAGTDTTLRMVYEDSDHGDLLLFDGVVGPDAIRFGWSRDLGARRQLLRYEYTGITATSFSTRSVMSPNSGETWVVVQQAQYDRRR